MPSNYLQILNGVYKKYDILKYIYGRKHVRNLKIFILRLKITLVTYKYIYIYLTRSQIAILYLYIYIFS